MDFNDIIGYALRIGVVLSAIFIVLGIIFLFTFQGSNGFSITQIASPNSIVNSSIFMPYEIPSGLPILRPLDYIYFRTNDLNSNSRDQSTLRNYPICYRKK